MGATGRWIAAYVRSNGPQVRGSGRCTRARCHAPQPAALAAGSASGRRNAQAAQEKDALVGCAASPAVRAHLAPGCTPGCMAVDWSVTRPCRHAAPSKPPAPRGAAGCTAAFGLHCIASASAAPAQGSRARAPRGAAPWAAAMMHPCRASPAARDGGATSLHLPPCSPCCGRLASLTRHPSAARGSVRTCGPASFAAPCRQLGSSRRQRGTSPPAPPPPPSAATPPPPPARPQMSQLTPARSRLRRPPTAQACHARQPRPPRRQPCRPARAQLPPSSRAAPPPTC